MAEPWRIAILSPERRALLLDVGDTNAGDHGRPLGTYAEKVKAKARELLIAQGIAEPSIFQISALYQQHMSALPSYREICEARNARARRRDATPIAFTPDELAAIAERFAMANDAIGQSISAKASAAIDEAA